MMAWSWITSQIAGIGAAFVLVFGAVFALRRDAVKDAELKRQLKEWEEANETREEIGDAVEESKSSGGSWRERLSRFKRSRNKRGL